MDPVILLLDFGETWSLSDPMPRYVAEYVCADFAHGVPWTDGRHPTGALIVKCSPEYWPSTSASSH